MRLRLPHPCRRGCALCAGRTAPDGGQFEGVLQHAAQTDQRRVYLQGTQLTASPHLAAAIAAARKRGLQVALVEDGPGRELVAKAPELRRLEVARIYVSLHGAAAEPGAATEANDSRKRALETLLALQRSGDVAMGVHVALTRRSTRELAAVLRVMARLSIGELLLSEADGDGGATEELDPASCALAMERVWLAANAQQVRLRSIGFERTRYVHPPAADPAPACDSGLLEMIQHRIAFASPRAGIRALGSPGRPSGLHRLVKGAAELRYLGLELAARRAPFVDVPPCLGGTHLDSSAGGRRATLIKSDACPACPFDERCPGASSGLDGDPSLLQSALRPLPTWYALRRPSRILILSSVGGDGLFYISTLPALADALRRRGAEVAIASPWLARWKADELPSLDHREEPGQWMSTAAVEAWLAAHDAGGYDLVITSDFPTARVAHAATPNAAARIVVLDFHMLETMDLAVAAWVAPGKRASDGGWWPSERMVVESGFPAHVQLYLNYGVPLEQVAWRPFPLCPAHFPPGPDVLRCEAIFSGGQHLRDLGTLAAATERLTPEVRCVDLYAFGEPFDANPHLRHRGSVSIRSFYGALAESRFVVLPLEDDANRAAGVTVLAMALMAGRPLIATDTAAVRDYVEHGVEALLVPPGDAAALADAIARLDADSSLLTSLAEGSRRAGRILSTEHWAEQIVSGHPTAPVRVRQGWRNW